MNQTPNYALSQWERTDQVRMDDFNADNAKIDAGLADHEGRVAALEAVAPKHGNCQIYTASYVGAANGGPVTHTFPHRPWLITVTCLTGGTIMFWPELETLPSNSYVKFTWNGNTVTWFGMGNAEIGMNYPGRNYQIVAFLDIAD